MEFQPMSPDEVTRTMQFLLQQQAQFAADLASEEARCADRFEKLSAKTDRIADGLIGLTGIVGRVTETLTNGIEQLAAAQQVTNQQLSETKTRLDELGDYVKTVGGNLNMVIEMFERHLREDHGHRPS